MPDLAESPIALVTGAARRVGAVIAQDLAAHGYRIWMHCHASVAEGEALAGTLNGQVIALLRADLSEGDARQRMAAEISDPSGPAQGRLDLLVNNAASFEPGSSVQGDDATMRRVFELNCLAPISLARALLPALHRAPSGAANIVNMADLSAFHPLPGYFEHSIAKAALAHATRAMAVELAPRIRVNAIAPGTVLWPDDPMHQRRGKRRADIEARIPLGATGSPIDVARAIRFFVASSFITGQILAVDGGRTANFGP